MAKKKNISLVRYALLPEFLPRLFALFTSGFVHISYLLAVIYQSLKLLPGNHPYLNPANKGRYGIRHVIGEAANNLQFKKDNIDQIAVFTLSLAGMFLLISQFVLFGISLFAHQDVLAGPLPSLLSLPELFSVDSNFGHGTRGEQQDIAFIILDRVFGMQNIFDSCISQGSPCLNLEGQPINAVFGAYPSAFHIALHRLLHFYSMGIFVISVIIIVYFIATVVAETAATGTAFGQRTNRAWAPVRLILFFALLLPLNIGAANGGLNAAQLITLWTAKFGSNFATNGWGYFNRSMDAELIAANTLLGEPTIPEVAEMIKFNFIVKTCKILEETKSQQKRNADIDIDAFIVSADEPVPLRLSQTNYETALGRADNGSINIVYGYRDEDDAAHRAYKSFVSPTCGETAINITSTLVSGTGPIQAVHYNLLQRLWQDTAITSHANCMVDHKDIGQNDPDCDLLPDYDFVRERVIDHNQQFTTDMRTAINTVQTNIATNGNEMTEALAAKGWAGAALWYNRIAEINGSASTAIYNKPYVVKFPKVMEDIKAAKMDVSESLSDKTSFMPRLPRGEPINYEYPEDKEIAPVLYQAYKTFNVDDVTTTGASSASSAQTAKSGNALVDAMSAMLGTDGIFSMRENVDVHPLAQLSALGKSMMQASITNLTIGGLGKLAVLFGGENKDQVKIIGDSIWGLGLALLILSVILYYILPFLPFIYFLFAVSGWVKSIFEAMVAMPLWALAHIRIDGEGIPGRDASNGYFLLLEILLRPILIVFGLLASIVVFSAMVNVLNDIFTLVVTNVGGFNLNTGEIIGDPTWRDTLRNPVDQVFYTVLYVILVYMMALANFKLVDLIPNNILRWSGVSVSTFQEGAGDPAGQISGQIYTGGNLMTSRVRGGGDLAALVG